MDVESGPSLGVLSWSVFLDHIAFCVISYQTPGGQIFCHGKRKINLMLNKTKIIVFTL